MFTLEVTQRKAGSPGALRRAGSVPAVVYGAHQASTPIAVDARAFDKAFKVAGESSVISLTGLGAAIPVLVQEVDLDPLTYLPRHIDFYAITKGEKVEVAVPLVFVGESAAVKGGANLIKVLRELEVKADPMNLPASFEVESRAPRQHRRPNSRRRSQAPGGCRAHG